FRFSTRPFAQAVVSERKRTIPNDSGVRPPWLVTCHTSLATVPVHTPSVSELGYFHPRSSILHPRARLFRRLCQRTHAPAKHAKAQNSCANPDLLVRTVPIGSELTSRSPRMLSGLSFASGLQHLAFILQPFSTSPNPGRPNRTAKMIATQFQNPNLFLAILPRTDVRTIPRSIPASK